MLSALRVGKRACVGSEWVGSGASWLGWTLSFPADDLCDLASGSLTCAMTTEEPSQGGEKDQR